MNPLDQPRYAWIVLNAISHIGPVSVRRLLDAFGQDPCRILQASPSELKQVKGIGEKAVDSIRSWKQSFDLSKELQKLEEANAVFIACDEPHYPSILTQLYDPPIGLYQRGHYHLPESQPAIAIIGSRHASLYGLRVARQFAQRLASMGFCIVSGLARGVDTAAHEGALEAGGDTIAVLGNGLDIIYPPENLDLYRRIERNGAVLSEFCFGRRADRQTFPMRNRIVSGLCQGVLIVESDVNGGSMITARFALEQNRQVYAIPGRIDQASSRGCHRLIKEGALLTTSVEDILDDLQYRVQQPELFDNLNPGVAESTAREDADSQAEFSETKKRWQTLSGELLELCEVLNREGALTVDALSDLTSRDVAGIHASLMMLELQKHIVRQFDGTVALRE